MKRRRGFLLVVPWDAAMVDRLRALDNLGPASGRPDPVALVLLSREFPLRSVALEALAAEEEGFEVELAPDGPRPLDAAAINAR